jgi:hypothetical protein
MATAPVRRLRYALVQTMNRGSQERTARMLRQRGVYVVIDRRRLPQRAPSRLLHHLAADPESVLAIGSSTPLRVRVRALLRGPRPFGHHFWNRVTGVDPADLLVMIVPCEHSWSLERFFQAQFKSAVGRLPMGNYLLASRPPHIDREGLAALTWPLVFRGGLANVR